MNDVLALLREDLRDFAGYRSARSDGAVGTIWLNANESPWPNQADGKGALRRYPEPQPGALRDVLAALYGCTPAQLLVGRGSDEGIDLLVRAFCAPAHDAVLVTPPVFDMYAACARLHGARLIDVALRDDNDDFRVDLHAVAQVARAQAAKLVFLCSPGNPAGAALAKDAVLALARRLRGHALVVVDEAYIEFSDMPSLAGDIPDNGNLIVLRTLSKAHALAAARIGCVIADPLVIDLLRRCQAPYPIPAPCAQQALQALSGQALAQTQARVLTVQAERERLRAALTHMPAVRRVYPSQGNYLLVRFDGAQDVHRRLLAAGIVVRDMRALPQLEDALRISVGTPAQNTGMLAVLRSREETA